MSRNLCRTDCYFCEGAIVLKERWRPIARADAGVYFNEYCGMPVAAAECEDCEAQYLAWGWNPTPTTYRGDGGVVRDLSFRSSFNDEPGSADYPRYEIRVERRRVGPWRKE